jgi:IS5 family transposase
LQGNAFIVWTWVRTSDDFGDKFSMTTTLKEGFVLGSTSMPGHPDDGHTLGDAIEQASILSEQRPKLMIVDKAYQGVDLENIQI